MLMKNPEKMPRNVTLLERTKTLLRSSGLRARKKLGQHFLIDNDVLETTLSSAELTERDVVIEVGSGLGVLTAELCGKAGRVIAVELDDRLAAFLSRSLASCNNLTVINRDILEVSPAAILAEAGLNPSDDYRVVANLPYYITSPVLRHFLEAENKPEIMVVMVQKEVAEEIAAPPGKMSLLSIGIQLYGKPEIVEYVPAKCFYPEPEVDSTLLRILPYKEPPLDIPYFKEFFTFVKAGFSTARKQLVNSLANGLGIPKERVRNLLENTGISPRRRAESLTLEEWSRLWREYKGEKTG
jgi:16S rRNA (adenine1518-N6/adenine1519-N6)-dimethyltransferase